jgi:autotransporter-associated beta strand protein
MKRTTCVWAWFAILFSARAVLAADVFWNVAGPADWNTAANWLPNRVPTGTDNATMNNGGTATITANTPTFTDLRFGDGSAFGGTVNQSAGTLIATGLLRMNMQGTAASTYTLSGGSASFTRINVNEVAGAATSTLNVQGGTLTIPTSGAGGGLGALFIGGGTGSGTGIVNVSGGMLTVGADTAADQSIVIGNGGTNTAQLNVSGNGVVTVTGQGDVNVGSTSPGAINQTGGTMNLFTSGASWLYVGRSSNGTYTLSGGTLTDPNYLAVGNGLGTTGTFNLSGGTATIGQIQGESGTGIFNFNGGTLRPYASNTTFMQGLTTANVQSGGAIIDTNGFNVTIAQPLLAAGGGLTKLGFGTLTLSGNNTFNGGLTVQQGILQIATINNAGTNGVLGNNTSVTLGGAGGMDLGILEFTGGSAASNMPFVLGPLSSDFFRIDFVTTNLTLSGVISGHGLFKDGNGTLTLTGNNTFTGGVALEGGTLVMGSPGALNATGVNGVDMLGGTLSLNGNDLTVADLYGTSGVVQVGNFSTPTLTVNTVDTNTFGGVLQDGPGGGSLSLVKNGAGTLTLSGNNTFSGGLAIQSGTLAIPTINNAGSSGPLGNNSGVVLGAFGQTGTLEYAGADPNPGSNMPFALAFGGTGGFQVDTAATDLTLSGVISGGGALVKTGPGTLTLAGTNTFTGGLVIQNGTLQVGAINNANISGPLGNNTGVALGSNGQTGTLDFNSTTAASSNMPFAVAAGGIGGFQIDAATTNLTLSGAIGGSGALSKTGPGTLILSGNDTFRGGVTVSAGTLALGSASALGAAGAVTVANGATLDLGGQIIGTNALSIQGPGVGGNGALINSSTFAASYAGTITAAGPYNVGGTGDITLNGSVFSNNVYALTKTGNDTLTLSGATDDSGLNVTVNSGTVVLAKTSSFSPSVVAVGVLTVNGGTAQLAGTGGNQIYDFSPVTVTSGAFDTNGRSDTFAALNIQGTGIGNGGALVNTAAAASTLTITNGAALTNNTTVGGTGDITVNGSFFGNPSYTLTKIGNNSLILSGATDNSHLQVAVTGGTVVLAKTSSHSPDVHALGDTGLTVSGGIGQLGGTGGDQIYDFSPVTVTSGAFDTNGRSETFFTLNLQGTGIGSAGALVNTAAAPSAITPTNGMVLTGDAMIGVTQAAGSLALNNAVSGNFALTKVGLGTLFLDGNNTFTGGVTINAGILALGNDGALNSTSPNSVTFGPASTGILDLGGHSVTVSGLTTDANVGTPVVRNNFPNPLAVLTVNNSGFDTFAGTVQASRLSIAMSGSGTLELSGATDNPFLDVTVNNGTVILAKTSSGAPNDVHAIGGNGLTVNGGTAQLAGTGGDQIYDLSPVTVTSGAFDTNGRTETFATLNLQGTGIGNAGALVNTAAAASAIIPTNGTVLTGNATIGVTQAAGSLMLNNGISGNFALTKVGLGTLILNGNNSFTGGVTVSGGTLAVGNAGALGPAGSAVSVVGGTLDLAGQSVGANALTILGNGVGNGALVNSGATAASVAGSVNVYGVNNSSSVGGPGDITLSGSICGSTQGYLFKDGNNTLTLSGTTDNTNLWLYVDSGTVILAKTSSSSPDVHAVGGPLFVDGGTVRLGGTGGDQIYDLAGVAVQSGSFDTNGQSETFGGLNLQGFGAGFAGALQDTATTASIITPTNGTTLTGNTLVGVAQGGSLTLNNAVVGNFSLVMQGPGTLSLTGDNTFSGGLTVRQGTLRVATVNNASTSGPLGNNSSVNLGYTFGGTGTLEYSGGNAMSNMPLTLVSPFQTLNSGGAIQIDNPASTLRLSGIISGGGALSVYGPGTLFLTGTNTFSGGLSVQSGTLKVGTVNNASNNGPLGPNQSVTLGSSGQTGTLEYDGLVSASTNMPFLLVAGGVGGFQIDFTNLTLIAPIDGGGGLAKSGPGTLILSGPNTFTGGVTINGGTLQLGNPDVLNSSAPNAVTFTAGRAGILSLNGNSVTISGLSTGTPAGTPVVQNGASTPAALTVSNPSDNTFAGALQDGVGGGALSLLKSGSGTLTLGGSKAYKGNTTVNAGTLRFALTSGSPTIGAGATATVASGATLELAGSVSALSSGSNRVNVSNGSSAPGLLVSGTQQQVGNIDGTGTTHVNAGSDLTANHIIQSALVIGGAMGSSATVTIAASDSSGNPLGQSDVVPTRMPVALGDGQEPAPSAGDSRSSSLLPLSGDPLPAPPNSSPSGGVAAVPEPATILLLALGGLAQIFRARVQLPARRSSQTRLR